MLMPPLPLGEGRGKGVLPHARDSEGQARPPLFRRVGCRKTPSLRAWSVSRPKPGGRGGSAAIALALLLATPAVAKTLAVGPGQPFDRPSAAIRAAQPGDTILIEPGEYYDCAAWSTPNLTIAGHGPGAVLTDTACQGKAILVAGGPSATIRNLTLARARVPDGNGAGIRLEAPGLRVEGVTFANDQSGLLSGVSGGSIVVAGCRFESVGVAGPQPTYAILAGPAGELLVSGSVFTGGQGGQVSSAAGETTLTGNSFAAPTTLPAVSASGGLTLTGNTFTAGPDAAGQPAAVLATGDAGPVLRGNRLLPSGHPMALLLDWTGGSPVLEGNQVAPGDQEVSSAGSLRHRASGAAHGAKDGLRGLVGRAKRFILGQ